MSSKTKGALTVLKFAVACFERGARAVAEPIGDDSPYDLIVDSGRLYRVQLKTASLNKKGTWQINAQRRVNVTGNSGKMTSAASPYREGEVDVLVALLQNDFAFFDNVHNLPATIALATGKWSAAVGDWSKIGLGTADDRRQEKVGEVLSPDEEAVTVGFSLLVPDHLTWETSEFASGYRFDFQSVTMTKAHPREHDPEDR